MAAGPAALQKIAHDIHRAQIDAMLAAAHQFFLHQFRRVIGTRRHWLIDAGLTRCAHGNIKQIGVPRMAHPQFDRPALQKAAVDWLARFFLDRNANDFVRFVTKNQRIIF